MKRRLLVAILVLLIGCSDWLEGPVVWSKDFGGERIVGFIDDSLVIVSSYQTWTQSLGSFIQDHGERSGMGHQRLCVYNYRVQEDGPRWCDTLNNEIDKFNSEPDNYARGQMTDSVIWGGDVSKSIKLWKVGEKAHEKKIKKKFDGCVGEFRATSIKQWLDGFFIVRGDKFLHSLGDSCQYAELDTAARMLTYKRLPYYLKWIEACDDVRAWNKDVYCFTPGKNSFEAVLLLNKSDSLEVPIKFSVGNFYGDVLRPNAHLCILAENKVSCSGIEWRGGLFFYENDEIVVNLE
ncbi:hypothetical protein [Fibrobacter intestinalis]|uniref:Uncharacterized protein n=1 Tax=Fibrobacter intestinalis TaxID=28122 RepID=A0A1T4S3F3_9BACT|nr:MULTISPECIES: hypothetical protein [Fibrobacter]PBC72751.1 hypothetical protein BGW94_0329 [Fibrobacter sp. NR9]SKA22830.1 hypothetical protein SAMN02745108_02958 [Fibrobacter intestinalis]